MTDKPISAQAAMKPRGRDLKDVDFSNLRSELENIRSYSGETLYKHLQKMFSHMILNSPDKALERFEEISWIIKQGKDPSELLKCEDNRDYKELSKAQETYVKQIAEHFVQPEADDEGVVP